MESVLQKRAIDRGASIFVIDLLVLFMYISCIKEIHIMHDFSSDFYGHEMRAVVLGYIRPELDYTSRGHHLLAFAYAFS